MVGIKENTKDGHGEKVIREVAVFLDDANGTDEKHGVHKNARKPTEETRFETAISWKEIAIGKIFKRIAVGT